MGNIWKNERDLYGVDEAPSHDIEKTERERGGDHWIIETHEINAAYIPRSSLPRHPLPSSRTPFVLQRFHSLVSRSSTLRLSPSTTPLTSSLELSNLTLTLLNGFSSLFSNSFRTRSCR